MSDTLLSRSRPLAMSIMPVKPLTRLVGCGQIVNLNRDLLGSPTKTSQGLAKQGVEGSDSMKRRQPECDCRVVSLDV